MVEEFVLSYSMVKVLSMKAGMESFFMF